MKTGVETWVSTPVIQHIESADQFESATLAVVWCTSGDHVARGCTIAIIDPIGVDGTEGVGDWVSTLLAAAETGESERLVQNADGVSGVEEFGVDSNDDAAQANDNTQNTDRQNEHEFGGNDHTSFVIQEILQHLGDPCCHE